MSNRVPYDQNPVQNEVSEWISNFNISHRREGNSYDELCYISKETEKPILTCRVYYPKSRSGGTNWCCLWIHDSKIELNTSGSASGWGYHRTSAALEDALRSANIKLHHFGGCGDEAMTVALEAILTKLGYSSGDWIYHKANA